MKIKDTNVYPLITMAVYDESFYPEEQIGQTQREAREEKRASQILHEQDPTSN